MKKRINPAYAAVLVVGMVVFAVVVGLTVSTTTKDAVNIAGWGAIAFLSPLLAFGLDLGGGGGLFTVFYTIVWTVLMIVLGGALLVAWGLIWGYFIAIVAVIAFWLVAMFLADLK